VGSVHVIIPTMRARWLLGVTLGATLMNAGTARAWQSSPHAALLWSYPDGYTREVPGNAVFRAFGYRGPSARIDSPIVMELDGREVPSSAANLELEGSWPDDEIEFQRRYQYPIESSEFVPPEPLAPGKHEVVFKVLGWDYASGGFTTVARYQFTVYAENPPNPLSGNVAITAITAYTESAGPGPSGPVPPHEALDDVCETTARLQHGDGNGGYQAGPPRLDLIDSGPATRVEVPPRSAFAARVDIAADGFVLGYFIDSQFVPAHCTAVIDEGIGLEWYENSGGQPSAVSFYAQAVLPTGLGEPHGFTGEVPIIASEFARPVIPDPDPDPESTSSLCSLGAIDAHTNGSDLAALALFVSSAALLRRSRRTAVHL
jgi:hypothetical protein